MPLTSSTLHLGEAVLLDPECQNLRDVDQEWDVAKAIKSLSRASNNMDKRAFAAMTKIYGSAIEVTRRG